MIDFALTEPTFATDVELITLFSGTKHVWSLPEINPGSAELLGVSVEPAPFIAPYLTYDPKGNTIEYNGKVIDGLTGFKVVTATITLSNRDKDRVYV